MKCQSFYSRLLKKVPPKSFFAANLQSCRELRELKKGCGLVAARLAKKCIFHGGQLRHQAQDNLIGLLACYLAKRIRRSLYTMSITVWHYKAFFCIFKYRKISSTLCIRFLISLCHLSMSKVSWFSILQEVLGIWWRCIAHWSSKKQDWKFKT